MEKAEFQFNKTTLEALPAAPPGKRMFYRDTKQPGLQLRVTDRGIKTLFVRRRIKNGADERITIGRFPGVTVEAARAKASTYVAELANGRSVIEILRDEKGEHTFAQLFDEYMRRHAKPTKRTWNEDQTKYDQYLARPLGTKKLSKIRRSDIAAIHSKITMEGHATTANRILALISSIFGKAIEFGLWAGENPCRGITRNKEKRRDRFLQADELPRFFAAVAAEANGTIRDYLNLSLLTGARRSNVLAMRWNEISIGRAEWRIPRTKNDDPQVVMLVPEAIEILVSRKDTSKSEFVFPGSGSSGHFEEPKKGWERILSRAQALGFVDAIAAAERWTSENLAEAQTLVIENGTSVYEKYAPEMKRHNIKVDDFALGDLRIHDLRRTLGSWQAKTGASLTIIGKSLNHRNIATTAIYARLDQDPVRESVARATSAILEAAGAKAKAPVVPLKKGGST